MSLLNRLERRFRPFAIPNLTTLLVVGQACLWIASYLPQGINVAQIALIPSRVLQGEVWRLATFLFMPPVMRPIFVVLYFLFFHMLGTTLERQWGTFRFNLFVLLGWLANVVAAFAAAAIVGNFDASLAAGTRFAAIAAPNQFLYSSLFLAFARLYPDYVIPLYFILPIRVKWLALIQWAVYGYYLVAGSWMERFLVAATVFNYLVFFGRDHLRDVRHDHRRRSFQAKARKSTAAPVHQCRVCGLSSNESPRMAFRYCSKCEGQACYCPEHIRDHDHVTAEAAAP